MPFLFAFSSYHLELKRASGNNSCTKWWRPDVVLPCSLKSLKPYSGGISFTRVDGVM